MIKHVVQAIKDADSILLTTHKQCDGDGLGAQLGLYHALLQTDKKVRVLNVDATPYKYRFLEPDKHIQYFDSNFDTLEPTDLALIFDTNDKRLVDPLYDELEKKCEDILFIDHHPVLKSGPTPSKDSLIDTKAASTGELAYNIIKDLDININSDIAKALYTSIAFDTQIFRYVRDSPRSHEIAATLLKHNINPGEVHKQMFGNFTASKLKFLAKALSAMEFYYKDRMGFLHIRSKDLHDLGLDADDSRDLIDTMMNVESVEIGALIREDEPNLFKMSLRSKGTVGVNGLAEKLGGGGHIFSAGASVRMKEDDLRKEIISFFEKSLS